MPANEEPESAENPGSWFPAIFFALVILAAILFTLYALLWDGGAHT
jgi:hypothetical protein